MVQDHAARGNMLRVCRRRPCLVCGKPDWCLYAADLSAAICQRVSDRAVKKCGEAGWLHIFGDRARQSPRRRTLSIPLQRNTRRKRGWKGMVARFEAALDRLTAQVNQLYPDLPNARWVALRLLDGDDRIAQALQRGELGDLSYGADPESAESAHKLTLEAA